MEFYKALFFKYYPICNILESERESRSVMSDSSQPHGILQARILEWVAFSFSRESSQPRDRTQVSILQVDSFPAEPQGMPKNTGVGSLSLLQCIFPTQGLNQGLLQHRQTLYQLSYPGSPNFSNFLDIQAKTNNTKIQNTKKKKKSG